MSSYEPDILAHGLDVIFCGVNPATTAAAAGHNFSNRSNRFWTVAHLAGFADVHLQPREERRLLEYRCGLTAGVEWPTRRAIDVPPAEFRKARPRFEAKIRRYAPGSVAFLGKRAFSTMMEQPDVAWGIHLAEFAGTTAWLLRRSDQPEAPTQPSALVTRAVDAGYFASFSTGRRGRATSSPPQFGQRPPSVVSAQSRQKVHSKLQITASVAPGGRSLLQHSQLGRRSNIVVPSGDQRLATQLDAMSVWISG